MRKYLLLLVVFLWGCSTTPEGYVSISGIETLSKMEEKEDFVLMISSSKDCYSCEMFKKESEKTIEENHLTIYELNYSELTDKEKKKLDTLVGSYTSLPVLIKMEDGNISMIGAYEYSLDPEGWKVWMQDMKLIEK